MASRLWSPRTGKVTTTASVDRRVVLVAALLASAAGSFSGGGVEIEPIAHTVAEIEPIGGSVGDNSFGLDDWQDE